MDQIERGSPSFQLSPSLGYLRRRIQYLSAHRLIEQRPITRFRCRWCRLPENHRKLGIQKRRVFERRNRRLLKLGRIDGEPCLLRQIEFTGEVVRGGFEPRLFEFKPDQFRSIH